MITSFIRKFIKSLIKKFQKYNWNVNDIILKIDDEIPNLNPNLGNRIKSKSLCTCIKSYNGACVYIEDINIDKFKNDYSIYYKEENLINISKIFDHLVDQDVLSVVANNTVPQSVSIKTVKHCNVNGIDIFVVQILELNKSDELYRDLINFQLIKNKYNLCN